MKNRILETVKGRDEAVRLIASYVEVFNEGNGGIDGMIQNRMVIEPSGIDAWDTEGSGEFFLAVCLNSNTAESCAEEIWQIETGW